MPSYSPLSFSSNNFLYINTADLASLFLFARSIGVFPKISASCKAAAKRKFKVWPSAYASGWGVRCTRNPSSYLGKKKKK